MQVTVLFFGALKDLAGRGTDVLALPDGATVSDVLAHYATQFPRLKNYLPAIATSINREYAARTAGLHDRDEVALLPPVSGGSEAATETARVWLTREPIVPGPIIDSIKHPEDGALAVFAGVVRNHSRDRRTVYLDYEAYEAMAVNQLSVLVREALGRFQVRDARIVHRLGRLQIGETSVLIVVASAHRAAAFEACRWLIDTLKRTVPIWKREYFADGAVWADGEPFPENLGASRPGGAS